MFFKYTMFIRMKGVSKITKIYRIAMRPAVPYAVEPSCSTSKDEERLRRFEREVVKWIHGPRSQRMTNCETEDILKEEGVVRTMKMQIIIWYGHVPRERETRLSVSENHKTEAKVAEERDERQRIDGRIKQ